MIQGNTDKLASIVEDEDEGIIIEEIESEKVGKLPKDGVPSIVRIAEKYPVSLAHVEDLKVGCWCNSRTCRIIRNHP